MNPSTITLWACPAPKEWDDDVHIFKASLPAATESHRGSAKRMGIWLVLLLPYFTEIPVFNANSINLHVDQMPHSAESNLGLHCLL